MSPKKESRIELTLEELLGLLKKTNLPTVIVEGKDDMVVYRRFESRLSSHGVDFLPVGGRTKVLELFKRRSEIPPHVKIIFIADKDVWVNTGIPVDHLNDYLLFTHGYSIENDIYIDGRLSDLLIGRECKKHLDELNQFIDWYALALNRYFQNKSETISLHPDQVLKAGELKNLMLLHTNEVYPTQLRTLIYSEHKRLLRGKSLLALLIRNTNYPGSIRNHSTSSILEMVAMNPGTLLHEMLKKIEDLLVA
jgi:hypothetical protein